MYFIVGQCREELKKTEYLIFVLVFHNFNFSRARKKTIIIITNITVCDNNKIQ